MDTTSFGNRALLVLALGLGAWVLHEAVDDPPVMPSAATPSGQGSASPPLTIKIAPAAAPPINVTLVPALQSGPIGDTQREIGTVTGTATGVTTGLTSGTGTGLTTSTMTGTATGLTTGVTSGTASGLTTDVTSGAVTGTASGLIAGTQSTTPVDSTVVYLVPTGSGPVGQPAGQRSGQTASPVVLVTRPGHLSRATSSTQPSSGPAAETNNQVLASDGSIVFIGPNGRLTANTGAAGSSGVVALGVDGSKLDSGYSTSPPVGTAQVGPAPGAEGSGGPAHANGSFLSMLPQDASTDGRSVAISGFEDHSVSVLGNDQIVTYDDSNVFVDRNGQLNANTGDTDSSGLNAVDVVGSRVRSGNSGDGEGNDDENEDEIENAIEDQLESALPAGQPARQSARQSAGATDTAAPIEEPESSGSSDDEDSSGNDEAAEDGIPDLTILPGGTYGTVTDEGASVATGSNSFVIGADGYDDVSIRTFGERDIVSYDDSNVVIGGTGKVNAQIGDSDTGGAVVMGIRDSDVQAGCEGDLCYSK